MINTAKHNEYKEHSPYIQPNHLTEEKGTYDLISSYLPSDELDSKACDSVYKISLILCLETPFV